MCGCGNTINPRLWYFMLFHFHFICVIYLCLFNFCTLQEVILLQNSLNQFPLHYLLLLKWLKYLLDFFLCVLHTFKLKYSCLMGLSVIPVLNIDKRGVRNTKQADMSCVVSKFLWSQAIDSFKEILSLVVRVRQYIRSCLCVSKWRNVLKTRSKMYSSKEKDIYIDRQAERKKKRYRETKIIR